jgi:putative oxidoreductase
MWTLQFLGKFHGLVPLVLRAMVGTAFAFSYGYGKIAPGGSFDGGQAFAAKGAGWAPLLYAGAWVEFLGGLALLAGFFTRWAAIGILAVVSYKVFGIHWSQGFAAHGDAGGNLAGYELPAVYASLCVAVMVLGPGSLSLDRLFFQKAALNE